MNEITNPTTFEDVNCFFGQIVFIDNAIMSTLKTVL
jgi:hypothetical protein